LEESTDARGIVTTRVLDELDRVTFVDYPDDSLDITYTYDDPLVPFSKGRLTAITRNGQAFDYRYDRFGRLTQDGALGYAYDANGNRSGVEYPGGVTAVSTFDYADRPESLTVQRSGEPDLLLAAGAYYAPSGPLKTLDLGNGLTESRSFTDRYFPSAITLAPTTPLTGAPIFQWTYTTDNVGNIEGIQDALTPANDKDYGYQDFQYYLTAGEGPWGDLAWTYDRIGNRLAETRDGVTDTYAYQPNGASGNTAILDTITLGVTGTKIYTYGPAGHLEQVSAPANETTFHSDAAGRLARLERPAGDAASDFLYDGRSFLTSARADSLSEIFTDGFEAGDGSCWTSSVGSDIGAGTADCSTNLSLSSVYSSEGVLHAVNHFTGPVEESTRYYFYFAGRPVAQMDVPVGGSAEVAWLSVDHLGTPVLATDEGGAVLWDGGFEPFGSDYSGASGAGVDLRFPGQWHDPLWGAADEGAKVFYNLNRWFQTADARYLSADPLGKKGSRNLYSYVEANPIVRIDQLGLVSWSCTTLELSVGGLLAAGVFYVNCESACVGNRKVVGDYLVGGFGAGLGIAIPFELGAWDLEDGQQHPEASSLEGSFSLRGCSATPVVGFAVTEVSQGKGTGSWSLSPTFGLGLNCYALGGGSTLIKETESCCNSPEAPPSIRARD
ncbi:MAG: RHS repeat-associated core domain-containing protein, partial [Acidobacteriota bacterium]|nr:RHS repeat-associated core domain-containing protein [Acidobacteriota bacterium]